MIFPGFCGPTYQARSRDFSADRCINLYPERDESGRAKSGVALHSVEGFTTLLTLPDDPVRALWPGDGRVFAVAGAKYGEIVAGPAFQDRGTVVDSNAKAYIFSNGTQLLIIAGGKAYYDNGGAASGSNAQLIDATDNGAQSGTYIDGYGVRLNVNTNDIYISALQDFSTWDILDFQTRTKQQDRLVHICSHDGLLWLIGKRSMEPWYNSGNADFPFEPVVGTTFDVGTEYGDTVVEADGSLFFLSVDARGGARVYRTRGFGMERVSTHGIEALIPAVGGDPVAFAYERGGHIFYVLNFTTATGLTSFVYDATDKLWHERGHWSGSAFDSYLARAHCFPTSGFAPSPGIHLVGARNSGKVYQLLESAPDFDGTAIRAVRQAPHLSIEDRRIPHRSLEVDIQTGTQQSGSPAAEMRYSEDSGRSWSTVQSVSMGASGNYNGRVIYQRLGSSRARQYEVAIPAHAGPFSIMNAFINVGAGDVVTA